MTTDSPADLERWATDLAAALELDSATTVDITLILDLARDAAHGVARPAAPITTFLVGYALGLRAGSPDDLRDLAGRASALAAAHTP